MANAYSINFSYQSNINCFSAIWQLTRVMKSAGWSVVGTSDGLTKRTLTTGTVANNANDFWGGNADPLADTYPTAFNTQAAWIVMRGPSTLKFSFITTPGNLIIGESVTQAGSGATGEFLGLGWNEETNLGYAIILPRTGAFNNSGVITGAASGASLTPNNLFTYVREVMFAKSSATAYSGTIYYICADSANESSSLFSTVADSAGCTASVPPGAGGTGNGFPSIAMCIKGSAGTVSHTDFSSLYSNLNTFGQTACVNATPSSGISADGSFYVTFTSPTVNPTIIAFTRVDNGDPIDIDPYVWIAPSLSTPTTWTNSTTNSAALLASGYLYSYYDSSPSGSSIFGYVGRGGFDSTKDKAVVFSFGPDIGAIPYCYYTAVTIRIANFPSATPPYHKLHPHIFSFRTNEIFYKGQLRWIFILGTGALFDTMDAKGFFIFSPRNGTSNPAIAIGPLDGSTTPAGA